LFLSIDVPREIAGHLQSKFTEACEPKILKRWWAHLGRGKIRQFFGNSRPVRAAPASAVHPNPRALFQKLVTTLVDFMFHDRVSFGGFACAIGIHPLIGYTSFSHLLPAYAGLIPFLTGTVLSYPRRQS
jgi:hypothetical protein